MTERPSSARSARCIAAASCCLSVSISPLAASYLRRLRCASASLASTEAPPLAAVRALNAGDFSAPRSFASFIRRLRSSSTLALSAPTPEMARNAGDLLSLTLDSRMSLWRSRSVGSAPPALWSARNMGDWPGASSVLAAISLILRSRSRSSGLAPPAPWSARNMGLCPVLLPSLMRRSRSSSSSRSRCFRRKNPLCLRAMYPRKRAWTRVMGLATTFSILSSTALSRRAIALSSLMKTLDFPMSHCVFGRFDSVRISWHRVPASRASEAESDSGRAPAFMPSLVSSMNRFENVVMSIRTP
mmetsp:Transcript_22723/g.73960  ORF Transcript_22723/g.73960 Transcript_22723/m.73960 type:complete len:301 (+) Transcript_22723:139-1041(+)